MKILIFAPYYLPHIDGLGILIDDFSRKLAERNFEITVFTPHLPKNSPETEDLCRNVKIVRFPAFYVIPNYPVPKIWKIDFWEKTIAVFRPKNDVVISYMRFFIVTFFALIYSKLTGAGWIHIEHGSSFVILTSKFKMFVSRLCDYTLGRAVFKFSDVNISASSVVSDFIKKFDSRFSPVIFNSIRVEQIEKTKPNSKIRNENEEKIIVAFVGRLYKWKGVERSIKIIKALPGEIKNKIVFIIVGNGEDFGKLESLIDKDDPIKLLGELPHREALSILKSSDIYLHSAMPGGGLSGSLLEAMYLECAVVATQNEGAADVIINGENGFLVENEDEFKEKFLDLITDVKKRQYFGENAKKRIKDNFNLNSMTEKYEEVFRAVIKRT